MLPATVLSYSYPIKEAGISNYDFLNPLKSHLQFLVWRRLRNCRLTLKCPRARISEGARQTSEARRSSGCQSVDCRGRLCLTGIFIGRPVGETMSDELGSPKKPEPLSWPGAEDFNTMSWCIVELRDIVQVYTIFIAGTAGTLCCSLFGCVNARSS